jgi:hypothetical protein
MFSDLNSGDLRLVCITRLLVPVVEVIFVNDGNGIKVPEAGTCYLGRVAGGVGGSEKEVRI